MKLKIIIERKVMKNSKFVLMLTALALAMAANPSDYIWFNYDTKTTVKPYSAEYYEVPLPC